METLFVGKNIIYLPVVESTNSYAIDLLKNVNPLEGTVVHAAHQTQGKGQRGSVWNSEPSSNLTVSIILKPSFLALKNQFYLYMIAALACYDTTAELLSTGQFDIKIKWPNDILVNRKKVAGILIENKLSNSSISHSVLGIGINLNQLIFPDAKAGSIKNFAKREINIEQVLKRLCYHTEHYYLLLKKSKLEELKSLYLTHLLGLGKTLNFVYRDSSVPFKVLGIGDTGLLLLQDSGGLIKEMDVKEVTWQL
ncbi:MAG: biotin--[acetyl-CoA-carboxylase] ligase [bacterium]|nr:biotin--[acetyl-CoA-carboxylase] ligase [bacterium]